MPEPRSSISAASSGATGEYYFNPLMSVYARYEHDPSGDFVEDEIKIGLKFRR
jgi:hypothetical protein